MSRDFTRQRKDSELLPPLAGLQENLAFEQKPPYSSPLLLNVRPYDTDEARARMGQRPGIVKYSDTQCGGDHPIVALCSITTTYIAPEGA